MAEVSTTNGNVLYILNDPNSVNINTDIINGVPQYQDMYIFAELRAERKGRSVLVTAEGSNNYNVEKTGLESDVNISFLGVNQNEDANTNPNYLNFTTNYYDGSNGDKTQYEGFGMTNIKVTVNSSFIPQVSIQFVDLRGLAFFNQKNSPYRILFDFPPPTFVLTIKGYYGRSLQYHLHLVKYTTEFRAENGNFVIDAQFVAITYAPLTDILFRYVVNFPLMLGETMNPNTGSEPKNTNDLILKLKSLYTNVEKTLKTDVDSQTYDNSLKSIESNKLAIDVVSNYKNNITAVNSEPFLILKSIQQNTDETNGTIVTTETISKLNDLTNYDTIIKRYASENIPTIINDKLYIVFVVGNNDQTTLEGKSYYVGTDKKATVTTDLEAFKAKLLKSVTPSAKITDNDVTISEITDGYNIVTESTSNEKTNYVGIDITQYYYKLYRQRFDLNTKKNDAAQKVNEKINNIVEAELGMKPTIYNVFKIILNDVDTFFSILKKTSRDAQDLHNNAKYKNLIIGSPGEYQDTSETIYSFPLIVYKYTEGCGGGREKRIAPIELSKQVPFPEMDLVYNFINSFLTQKGDEKLYMMKATQNENGTNVWIPMSPLDSVLCGGTSASPYLGIDPSNDEPISLSNDNRLTQLLQIVLKRFYILSQYSIPDNFYGIGRNLDDADNAYLELFAEGEAANLAASMVNPAYRDNIKEVANNFNKNLDNFYNYLEKNVHDLYNLTTPQVFMPVIGNGGVSDAYLDKRDSNFNGVNIDKDIIDLQDTSGEEDNPVVNFKKNTQVGLWTRIVSGKLNQNSFDFTKENVIYVKDGDDNSEKYQENSIDTRFLAAVDATDKWSDEKKTMIGRALTDGNISLDKFVDSKATKLKLFNNVVDVWVDQLSNHDDEIKSIIRNDDPELSSILLLSNFGFTLSPFDIYPHLLNSRLFNAPAVFEVPSYLPAYIGALVDANTNGVTAKLKNFFTGNSGNNLESLGLFIFADISDIENYLSDNDKQKFKLEYEKFVSSDYTSTVIALNDLYETVSGDSQVVVFRNEGKTRKMINRKKDLYEKNLANGTNEFINIILPYISRSNIINFTQLTFQRNNGGVIYDSLFKTNHDTTSGHGDRTRTRNETYFKKFFSTLLTEISKNAKELKEEEDASKKLAGDDDIATQTYYSFKNINDKWLSGPKNNNEKYPFNLTGKDLIDLFAFVDRGMNPVGNTVINPEILIQMLDDPNISVFGVISQLLSLNGFEFFPLQNFMTHDQLSWESSFKIDVSNEVKQQPAFVCMYIGGTSSYPTGISDSNTGFKDDGIIDITATNATDFNTPDDCAPVPKDDAQIERNPTSFPWRQIRAFRVLFGTQNQSMFTDIKIDSKEYPETNESIQILARIAGDNKVQAPIPKGQNLYNLYENRAYKATVSGFGNAMIQPTQYFQLENIPLFNGAYLILSVEHTIEPNKMMTTFSGTKVLRYPVPRVTNVAAMFGFDGDNSISSMSPGEVVVGAYSSANLIDQAKYNSMYTENIQ